MKKVGSIYNAFANIHTFYRYSVIYLQVAQCSLPILSLIEFQFLELIKRLFIFFLGNLPY